jgi:hypothetical protein
MLLLPNGQMGKGWELSKKGCSSGKSGALDRKVLFCFKGSIKKFTLVSSLSFVPSF